jgi:hypothetical protein
MQCPSAQPCTLALSPPTLRTLLATKSWTMICSPLASVTISNQTSDIRYLISHQIQKPPAKQAVFFMKNQLCSALFFCE